MDSIEDNALKRLEIPLITRSEEYLDINFDKVLERLFNEVYYWQRLGQEAPPSVLEICKQQEQFRILRESVLLVVRDYNNIIKALSPEERRLFKERIEFLDSQLKPAFSKLTWLGSGLGEFLKNGRTHAQVMNKVTFFYSLYS